MSENQNTEKKSLKIITGHTTDWCELAKDCVSFANARGGIINIGIENNDQLPPVNQQIDSVLPAKVRRRIAELTINVSTFAEIITASNSGQYIKLTIHPSASTIASTTDGRYYMRISDTCKPIQPDELLRLVTDKPAYIWETQVRKSVKRTEIDSDKLQSFYNDIQGSDRVSSFIKQKTPNELLDNYFMAEGDSLTNLGVLWVGKRADRAKLLYAPVIQFFKYDENNNKIKKLLWDDFSLNPKELIEAIWTQIPEWHDGIDVSDGMFRKFILNYEEEVIREILINALVHRPYTTRGDIYINLYPDRLEIHNPGLLPFGVTPDNILHKSIRRNEHLSKVFYDLKLMDREGSGYDKLYEILLSNGKQIPIPAEGDDRVWVTVRSEIMKPEIIRLIQVADESYQLKQREKICLGLIAQHTTLSAVEFSKILNFQDHPNAIRDWLGKLPEYGLVKSKGKTKGLEYFVDSEFLRKIKFKGKTNLKKIEIHRLKELIIQDLKTYPESLLSEIHERIGKEIKVIKIRSQLNKLIAELKVKPIGSRKYRRYSLISQNL
jgi:ATP-dependent DNA helicase RecG